jgi:hypothetical protein
MRPESGRRESRKRFKFLPHVRFGRIRRTRVRDVGAVGVLRSDGRQKVERIGRGRSRRLAGPVPRAQGICSSENWLKFAQFACTVPTQLKSATLSAIKTVRYKSFITRSG